MATYDKSVGTRGTLRIVDNGSVVSFYVLCGDPYTWSNGYSWYGTVNGVGVGGTVALAKGFGSRLLGSWTVSSTQTVTLGQNDTGTQGLGGAAKISATITRATVPPAPTPLGIDEVTATSFRYRFSSTGNGGAAISQWQIQLATNAAFTTGVKNITSTGTSTISGLNNHTQYWVRSRGQNAKGWGPYSAARSTTTLGHPTAPRSPVATPSGSVTGHIGLTWTAPATAGAGGIIGYNIFRDGAQIATITGTTTSYTDTGRTPYISYSYTIAARNAYSNSVSGMGPKSAAATAVAPGPPTAPRNLVATPDGSVPGRVNLTWSAPTTTGTGGITKYRIWSSSGVLGEVNGNVLSFAATNLKPGTSYSFSVSAQNALAQAEGTRSAESNVVSTIPVGEPQAPTGVTASRSSTVSNRIVVSWNPPAGTLSGFSVFRRDPSGAVTLLAKIGPGHTSFPVDNLIAGETYTFEVRARTAYTDTLAPGYPGDWGGPASAPATATASFDNSQTVPTLGAITSATNAIFNGTYTITAVSALTIRYAKTAADIASVASGGSIVNNTNTTFNGTYTIATPTPTTITYPKTATSIPAIPTSGGLVSNLTNVSLNGVKTVTAVNVGANLVSYANTGADFASTAVPVNAPPGKFGTVKNRSNAIFNGAGKVITAITEYTITYSQTNANVAESNAAGSVTNVTNRDVFNGEWTVSSIPAHNIVKYARTAANVALRTWFGPNGSVSRVVSPATLDIRFRSGWSG